MLIPIDLKSGEPNWITLQEEFIDGLFRLQDFLGADPSSAVFKAEMTDGATAVVKFYRVEEDRAAEEQIAVWEDAKGLDHPNLIRVVGAGRVRLGEHRL